MSIAFVDILSGEEEAVVVGPHGALVLAEVAGDVDEAAVAVGARGLSCRSRVDVDLVAPRERRAPAIVVEGAGEVVHVGGAVAFRAVVRVVEVQLVLVAPETAVLRSRSVGSVVVDAGDDGLAVAALEEGRR